MDLNLRILAFVRVGKFFGEIIKSAENRNHFFPEFKKHTDIFETIIENNKYSNPWFTSENILFAINSLAAMLSEEKLRYWISKYQIPKENTNPAIIQNILAGNIPLVGFHDMLCTLITGNIFTGKLSGKDDLLLSATINLLTDLEPEFLNYVNIEKEIVKKFDAVIATGSDNSSRYFNYYFGKFPHIIRKNRNSAAILSGYENTADYENLATDIFSYFGLGCRNVSKLFVPENWSPDTFYQNIEKYAAIINHNKYANNYEYNRAIYLMNREKFFDNGFLLLKENEGLSSPIGVIYYEHYTNIQSVKNLLDRQREKIQCVASSIEIEGFPHVPLGCTQKPELWDYADSIDTLNFLLSLTLY